MGSLKSSNSGYGPGTYVDTGFTPVPEECKRLLKHFAAQTPGFTQDEAVLNAVRFEGDDLPCIPGPIKSQAITAVLHAMFGIVGLEILKLRGESDSRNVVIDTNHAGLYPATPPLVHVDGVSGPAVMKLPTVPQWDKDRASGSPLLLRATAIYPTAENGVWFQMHASLSPWATLSAIGMTKDAEANASSLDEAYSLIREYAVKFRGRELEQVMLEHGLPGSIVHSPESWRKTDMAKSIARHPLINYKKQPQSSSLPPCSLPKVDDKRPLAGVKVVELARIIAATAAGAALASMGAEVIRVNSPNLKDYTTAQTCSLMAGKITIELDLNDPKDHARLTELFEQADVIIQGYRLGSLDRRGFGLQTALQMAERRGKGIIYLDENCYGPDGYYAERPGWQQVADAATGSSYIIAQSFGLPEGQGVLPSLPISDMSAGLVAALTSMCAIRDRTKNGGSYHCNSALVAGNMAALTPEVRLYQPEVVQKIQDKYRFAPWSSDTHVAPLYYEIMRAWEENSDLIKDEKYYVHFSDSVFGADLRVLAPIVRYPDCEASTPKWTSPPVPFCHHEYRGFSSP